MAAALEKPADPKPKSRVNSADPDRRLTTCSTGSAYSLSGNAPYAATTTPSFTSSVVCDLHMIDSFGDGWNGATWSGLGQ